MPPPELVRVRTTLGDRIYPANTRIYSSIGGNVFFHERVGDLNGHEKIIWRNDSIDKTLPQLEPDLQRNPRYALAEKAVFAFNSEGLNVPRFRIELIRTLAAKGMVAAENLEQKIMWEEGKDFSGEEYDAMADFLWKGMQRVANEDGAPTRSDSQIRAWLEGGTWGPSDPRIFYSLACVTGSRNFDKWFMAAGPQAISSSGFWGAYRCYVMIRQKVMRKLTTGSFELRRTTGMNGHKDPDTDGFEKTLGQLGLDTTAEADLIISQFIEEVNTEYSMAKVLGVEPLALNGNSQTQTHRPAILHKGAHTGNPLKGTSSTSLTEIISRTQLLGYLTGYAFRSYVLGCNSGTYKGNRLLKEVLGFLSEKSEILSNYVLLHYGFLNSCLITLGNNIGLTDEEPRKASDIDLTIGGVDYLLVDESGRDFAEEARSATVHALSELLMDGTIDAELGTTHFASYKLVDNWARMNDAIPKIHGDWTLARRDSMDPHLDRQMRREKERALKRLEQRLLSEYGFDTYIGHRVLLAQDIASVLVDRTTRALFRMERVGRVPHSAYMEAYRRLSDRLWRIEREADYIRSDPTGLEIYKEFPGTFYTEAECRDTLKSQGLDQFMRFIPQTNFVFDSKSTVNKSASN